MIYLSTYKENWLRRVLLSLNHAFVAIEEDLNTLDGYDGLFAKEDAEATLGIAFVAAQTYITGVVADIRKVEVSNNKRSKIKLLSSNSPIVKEKITSIQLIDTVANFYKHNEEWSNWQINDNNKRTIETLRECGITKNTEFPCYEAATMLWPENKIHELTNLLSILIAWREQVLNKNVAHNKANSADGKKRRR